LSFRRENQMTVKAKRRIGFVSTRLAGTDGVSLEVEKWSSVFGSLGYDCFYFAGETDWAGEASYVVEEAHFDHPEISAIHADLFENYSRSPETSEKIQRIKLFLKNHLYKFIDQFNIDLLIAENSLSMPMNVPLGLAITELVAETNISTIAHHHDFAWERQRYKVSAGSDYQLGAFPPILPSIRHVVINSYAARQLALRTGLSSTLIPNVMDFEALPPRLEKEYVGDFRRNLNIEADQYILLQPTRIVPRKRIELAIELARRLGMDCVLLITHSGGDEGNEYERHLREYARLLDVRVIFAAEWFGYRRALKSDGRKIYSLADAYLHADIVTYPSTIEGFGNAFLEAIYYRKPIVISTYEIFRADIQPKGFRVIGFGDFITEDVIERTRQVLHNPGLAEEIVSRNFELGRRHYSYPVLKRRLAALVEEMLGLE